MGKNHKTRRSNNGVKLPEITLDDWIQAEYRLNRSRYQPRPEGSITALDYSQKRGITRAEASRKLKALCEAGMATRQKWNNGGSMFYVYTLKR